MGTALESVEKKAEEGLDWMKVGIRSKVGAVRAGERRGATYLEDVEGEAWAVEVMIDELHRRYVALMSIGPYHPDPAEERRKRQLALAGIEAAEPTAEELEAELERFLDLPSTHECKEASGAIYDELERLGLGDHSEVAVREIGGARWADIVYNERSIRVLADAALGLLQRLGMAGPIEPDVALHELAGAAPPNPPRVPAPEEDPELEAVEGELATELDRVLGTGVEFVRSEVTRGVDHPTIEIGSYQLSDEDDGAWSVTRDAPRVLGALRQLHDGAGAEAIRAILCGLAETVVCTCGAPEDDLGVVVHADDCALCGVVNDQVEDDGDDQVQTELKIEADPGPDLPGRPAGEPAKRRARKANGARA